MTDPNIPKSESEGGDIRPGVYKEVLDSVKNNPEIFERGPLSPGDNEISFDIVPWREANSAEIKFAGEVDDYGVYITAQMGLGSIYYELDHLERLFTLISEVDSDKWIFKASVPLEDILKIKQSTPIGGVLLKE